nr:histidine kinase [Bacteroidota bacterium]
MKSKIIRILSGLTIWHVVFWLTNLALFTFPFFLKYNQEGVFQPEKLYPGLIYTFYLAVIVYFNYFVLIPRFAAKKKVGLYFVTVTVSVLIVNFFFAISFTAINNIPLSLVNAFSFSVLEVVYIIITSFFKLFKEWIEDRGLQLKIKEIEKQKAEAELLALKAQLNPHFLFNVLNNIYSHSLHQSELTPTIVLKLSELMSYVLYDCRSNQVPISREVEFIKNYIELEKIRLEEKIEIDINTDQVRNIKIPPLLFVPFIENAFKHGINSQPKKKQIQIELVANENSLIFRITNTVGEVKEIVNKKTGGIGIENVKKRLELLFPDRYSLHVLDKGSEFRVSMIIHSKFGNQ